MSTKVISRAAEQAASLESRIRGRYEQMSAVEQKLSDVILASPGHLAMQTATELAISAGVSKATTTRFFRALGYDSYEKARRDARKASTGGSPLYLQHLGEEDHDPQTLIQHHLNQEVTNLIKTYESLAQADLFQIAQAIAKARRVVLIGYRHSQTIAVMFRSNLIQVRSDILLLPAPGDSLAEYLAGLDERDVAICIGLRRRVPQLESGMAAMNALGVQILYISDVLAGKPAKLAKWVIRCHTEGTLMFDSNSSIAGITNLLCSLVGRELSSEKSTHLANAEVLHQELGELE
ncbi:MurR/RpiR family transcriptional regulator [Pseudomonas sp. CDFA 553]|uniref:MurR/RpiR family transcriptional regulator n=1 Tax=Pseudomonas quasicaspiana TaxID=2829821 RepID=UPI001E3C4538|nr:MurR/RpiR family transcriptional regulator [Pseudomonas quasicaspiana]MCD5986327.1 MurR/RpiR family transcriptional regulator [Pseudomonas quasicaspiana]